MQDVRNDYDFPTTICLYSSFLSLSPISFYYFEEIQKILKYYNEKKEIDIVESSFQVLGLKGLGCCIYSYIVTKVLTMR